MPAAQPIDPACPAWAARAWRSGPGFPQLGPGTVDIWVAALDTAPDRVEQYHALLHPGELRRTARLKVDLVARRYIVSRGILRFLLSRYTGLAVEEHEFVFGELGKPSLAPLADGRRLSFNNTDSGGLAIYAFAWDRELGVDLERLPRAVRAERISRRRFAGIEADAISNLSDTYRDSAFLACWTRKEAWGKATGKGIRYNMREIDLCSRLDQPVMHPNAREATATGAKPDVHRWTLTQLRPTEDSLAALVTEGAGIRINAWRYSHRLLDVNCNQIYPWGLNHECH